MHPELKAYLDEFEAKAQARHEALLSKAQARHEALLSKLITGASTPQPARPAVVASDGGLAYDASVPAVVPDVFTATNQAQEAPAVAHDAPAVCIEMAPTTCSTGGLDRCTDRDNPVALSLIPGSALASISAPPEDSTTPTIEPSAVFEYVRVPLTTCSTDCSGSDIGAPSPTTQAMPSKLLQAAAPALNHELMVLRPEPWPSFIDKHTCTGRSGPVELTPSTDMELSKDVVPCPTLPPFLSALQASLTLSGPLREISGTRLLSYMLQPAGNISSNPGSVIVTLLCTTSVFREQPALIVAMRRHSHDSCIGTTGKVEKIWYWCPVKDLETVQMSNCECLPMEEPFDCLQYVQLQLWRLPRHTHGSVPGEKQSEFSFWPVKVLFSDADGNTIWYMPWSSVAFSQECRALKQAGLLPHDTYVMKHFSSALNFLRKSSRHLQNVQLKLPWPSFSSTCRVVQIMNMSVQWQFLSQHGLKGSGHVEFKKILEVCATTRSAKGLIELEFLNVGTCSDCLVSFVPAIHVSCARYSDQSMMLHLNPRRYPSNLEMADPGQISLCNYTMHISASVQRWVFSSSANIRADALITLAFSGTTCRISDTATHAGFSMAGAEYFAHWDFLYEFHQEALITLVRELWHTYEFRFFSVTLVHLVQWHNMFLAHGLVLCTMHKRVLQIVEELRDIVPPILLRNNGSENSVAELTYSTSIWNREGCNCVIWMTPINEEESTSTVIPPVRSYFSGFASSRSLIHSVHAVSYSMPSATTLKWATKFGALILGKLSRIFFCLQLVQLKHPWPSSVAAMSTQQLSFRMKTSTESMTILKIYSRMFQDWIAHLLGSTSASGDHLGRLWDPGGFASNLCSTRALTSPRHYLFVFWTACVLSICMQMRVEKPMTSGELNQWMTIIFFLGTLEFDCSLDTLLVLLGFMPPFCCQLRKSTRSGKICVLGASDDLGSFTVVQGGYLFSASNQEKIQGGRGFIIVAALFMQGIVDHKFYLGLDQVPHGSDYYLSHDRFSKLVQVHLNYGYYHGDPGMIKDLQAPWDPGKLFTTAAWGQAAFQEGRDVRDLLGSTFGSTWAEPSCALTRGCHYKYWGRKRRGGIRVGSGKAPAAPFPFPFPCSSSSLLPPLSNPCN